MIDPRVSVFPAITTESFLNSRNPLITPRNRTRSPYDIDPHNSEAISVENYDPRSQTKTFEDEFTVRALQNLRIRARDLYFPGPEDLLQIAGDRELYRERLIDRAHRLAAMVHAERDRLILEKLNGRSEIVNGRSEISQNIETFPKQGSDGPWLGRQQGGMRQAPSSRPRVAAGLRSAEATGGIEKFEIFRANRLIVQGKRILH
jgi:hypothetical protein